MIIRRWEIVTISHTLTKGDITRLAVPWRFFTREGAIMRGTLFGWRLDEILAREVRFSVAIRNRVTGEVVVVVER